MTRATTNQHRCARLVLAGGLALSLGFFAGCDNSTPMTKALENANLTMTALSPGGAEPVAEAQRRDTYNKIVSTLRSQSGKGTPSEESAAALLIAQAQIALAEIPSGAAARVDRESLNTLTRIEAAYTQWLNHNALAQALSAYDPKPELAEIESQIAQREAGIKEELANKAAVDAKVTELRAQAAAKAKASAAKRQDEAKLLLQMANQSAVEGARTLEQAVAIRRAADGLEAEAADLNAQAAQIAPRSDQIQLAIDRLTNQRNLLQQARADVNQRAAAAAADAQATLAIAAQDAADIADLVRQLAAERAAQDGGKTHYETALETYQSAADTASKAARGTLSKGVAHLTLGSAQQSLGDTLWSRAHGLARLIETFDALAGSKPALPQAGEYRARADALRAEQQAALDAATAAYSAAFEAYKSAGATGDAQSRMDRVLRLLDRAVDSTSKGTMDLGAELSAGGESAAAGGTVEPGSPLAAIDEMLTALKGGQYDSVFGYLHVSDPQNQQVLDAAPDLVRRYARLDSACQSKYGSGFMSLAMAQAGPMMQSFGGAPGGDPSAMLTQAMGELDGLSADQFTVEVDGDTATVFPPDDGGADPIPMRRGSDGRWLVDLSDFEMIIAANPDAPKYRELILFSLPILGQLFDQVTTEVEAGRLATAADMMNALNTRSAMIMMQIMGKMQELGIQMPGAPGMPPHGGG